MASVTPRFSIVIPAYNAEDTLASAIESVFGQTGDISWELVVVDDGSTDATRSIAEGYAARDQRVTVISQPNVGTGGALTTGITQASGEFVVQLGADDELLPEYCSVIAALIDAEPDYDIYASNAYRIMPDGRRELYHQEPRFRRQFSLTVDDLLEAPLIYGTAAFRREWFVRLGGFRAEFYNEDYDFWLRALMAGARHIHTPRPLALYRVRQGQKTADERRAREDDIRILRDAIGSGLLGAAQRARAERAIALLRRNVAFRAGVERLVGPRMAGPAFRLAHKLAYFVRPHRRAR